MYEFFCNERDYGENLINAIGKLSLFLLKSIIKELQSLQEDAILIGLQKSKPERTI